MGKKKKAIVNEEEELRALAKQNLKNLMSTYDKRFKGNKYSAVLASDFIDLGDIAPLKTNHISFDCMTGIGGLPVGKIIEFTGEEGSHKSNYAWECVGAIHAENDYDFVVWVDAEKAIDLRVPMQRKHISNMGVDFTRLIILVPDTSEQCWSLINEACDNGARLIVLDSVSALVPKKELNAGVEADGYPALPASINRGFRSISKELWKSGSTLIEINQVRENLEMTNKKYTAFEDQWKTTGGKGLKHWLTLRLFFKKKKIKILPDGADSKTPKIHVGDEVTVSVIKTRLSPIMDKGKLFMYHKSGFDKVEELLSMLIEWELLYKETPRARNYMLSEHEDDWGEMSWDDWYDFFDDDLDSYNEVCDLMRQTYFEYYSEDNDIIEDLEAQEDDDEEEYDEEEE